jgi:ankyrin repeat protein
LGEVDIVKALLSYGAELERRGASANRPIHLACSGGFEDVVTTLILRGCCVNATNANGALPSALSQNFKHIKAIVRGVEQDGEKAREQLRRDVAARLANEAIKRRERERERVEAEQLRAQEDAEKAAEANRERIASEQRLAEERDQLATELVALREKEAERLKLEEKKRAKKAKAAASKKGAVKK